MGIQSDDIFACGCWPYMLGCPACNLSSRHATQLAWQTCALRQALLCAAQASFLGRVQTASAAAARKAAHGERSQSYVFGCDASNSAPALTDAPPASPRTHFPAFPPDLPHGHVLHLPAAATLTPPALLLSVKLRRRATPLGRRWAQPPSRACTGSLRRARQGLARARIPTPSLGVAARAAARAAAPRC